jgi:hypothetical protein
MKAFALLGLALLACAAPAFGIVNVTSPASGAQVISPFGLNATATACSSQSITAMGYSVDNSTATTIVNGTSVNAQVTSTTGAHTLHVKSWGNLGASCVTNVAITVALSPAASVPANAIAVKAIHALKTWQAVNDNGTGSGTSTGITALLASPSLSGVARQFATSYTNSAGERYFTTFGADTAATNFLYDGWFYLVAPSGDIANLEMDMNQVMPNGQTVIYGFQCDGYTDTWDYTENAGTPQSPIDQWRHSTAGCNPRSWSTNAWHHVQVSYSRDSVGNVTYKSVWFDGAEQDIYATVPSAFALGWGSALLTNFQVDGYGGYGSATVYLDSLTIYRW